MINIISKVLRRVYFPLNKIEISRNNLLSNYKYLSSINNKLKVAPVLKSNGYGQGIHIIGQILDLVGAPFFCVDSLYEAIELRKNKIKTPILIMGYIDPRSLKIKKFPFSYAVWDMDLARAINSFQKGASVHIFVDTGMHREGVPLVELEGFITELKKLKNINIVGLMSHFASANLKDNPQNKEQIKNFKRALEICDKNHLGLKYKHQSASSGLLSQTNSDCNIARSGKALYGIDPLGNAPQLKPVLKFMTKIVQIKKLKKGDKVGYEGLFTAQKDTFLGILPVGYNDGVDRRLGNKGFVKIGSVFCPIVGMVSMNVTTIDLLNIKNPKVGDEVIIYSDISEDKNSIENTAKICNTIVYDILVNLVPTTRREIV